MQVDIEPGAVSLASWRRIYFGDGAALDPACRKNVERSAKTVETILATGYAVYGINTGFGKLANVRIEPHDLAVLQRFPMPLASAHRCPTVSCG